jgi:NitT/TauT family transport system permease protein
VSPVATTAPGVTAVDRGDPPAGRENWPALPRRRPARRRVRLLAIRGPISARARAVLTVLSVAVPLVAWFALSAGAVVSPTFLPSPARVWAAGADMAGSGQLFTDAWATVDRVLIGFGLAVVVSVPLGLLMGSFQAAQAALEPVIGLLRYLPASAFIPLLIIWLGLGEPSKVAMLLIGTVFFNTLMTADAVRLVPGALIDVSYTLGARRAEVLCKVVVPHALPGMLDAIRVNAAAAWNFVVVAELINSESGLGYRIVRAQRFLQTDKIFAVLVVIGILGLTIDILLRILRDRVGRWVG